MFERRTLSRPRAPFRLDLVSRNFGVHTASYGKMSAVLSGDEEAELIARLRKRDEAAFNTLVRLHQHAVYRLLARMLGDEAEAEDVAQDVFVTVFKAIDGFRGESKLSTWIHRIATNHARNRIKYHGRRRRGAERPIDDSLGTADEASAAPETGSRLARPDHAVEGLQAESHLQRALAELDEEQRTLVVLRDLEHLSYEEIMQITGLPSGTVKSRLHRARTSLHERYRALSEGKT
jgi:RNA polymerase sigma-70 factor (ECF subfamily)